MKPLVAILSILLMTSMPSNLMAQLVPNPAERATSVCPVRPADPAIIVNMDFRDADRSILLKNMYKASAYNDIVQSGTCSCEQRFPPWDPVVKYYLERYAEEQDANVLRERRSYYLRSSNINRPSVREICTTAGNWN